MAQRLDVVDDGRAHVETEDGGKVRRLDARVGALALERLDQPGLLAADVGARTAADIDLELHAGAEDVLAEESFCVGLGDRLFEDLGGLGKSSRM